MRELVLKEMNQISGGETVEMYFDLYPGVEIVGFEQILVGYDTVSWTESTGFFSSTTYEVQTPIYQFNPIYSETVTMIYA